MYPESSKYQISVLGRVGEVKKKKAKGEKEKGMKLLNSSNEQERK